MTAIPINLLFIALTEAVGVTYSSFPNKEMIMLWMLKFQVQLNVTMKSRLSKTKKKLKLNVHSVD